MATSSFDKKFVVKPKDIPIIEAKLTTKNKGKKINRNIMRGERLKPFCYKAKTTTNECSLNDKRIYCYGIIDKMYDELIEECKYCKAYVSNVKCGEE